MVWIGQRAVGIADIVIQPCLKGSVLDFLIETFMCEWSVDILISDVSRGESWWLECGASARYSDAHRRPKKARRVAALNMLASWVINSLSKYACNLWG